MATFVYLTVARTIMIEGGNRTSPQQPGATARGAILEWVGWRRALTLGSVVAAVTAGMSRLPIVAQIAAPPVFAASAAAPPRFVGGDNCVRCHTAERDAWAGSHHALAMQPADKKTMVANFADASFTKDGVTSTFRKKGDSYVVRTDGPDGSLHDYRIAYTFGVDPLQQYLVPFPGGRLQALGIAWDARPPASGGQRWFHLYPDEKIGHDDVLHWTRPLQSWNYMCADCHSTDPKQNYRVADDRYAPSWSDVSVSCEACHGPGSAHLEWAKNGADKKDPLRGLPFSLKDTSGGQWIFPAGQPIARRTKPPSSRVEIETCAPCHARRAPITAQHTPGEPLEMSYRSALLDDPLYEVDGQIHDEVYEYGSFLQSRMYQSGVTCSNCHDPHSGRRRAEGNALCAQCHLSAKYDGPQHHFHRTGTEAAQCVSCHMPAKVYMVVHQRRDHSFRVPRPDLTVRLGTPNTCNQCHRDRSAQWAADAAAKWYGPNRRQGWHWADAIAAGRGGHVDAERELVRAIDDRATPPIARATALELLTIYLSAASMPLVERSLGDPEPLVRRSALVALGAVESERRLALAVPLLVDPIRSVRFEALSGLLDLPREQFDEAQRSKLDRAIEEYRRAESSLADRPESHLNLGALDARLGRLDAAETEYKIALRQQPSFIAAYVNLADLYSKQGQEDRTIATLEQALRQDAGAADVHHAIGLSLVRQKRPRDALPELEKAANLRPENTRYAYVYAIALHETGDGRRALEVLEQASSRRPADREILMALVAYNREKGDERAAAGWERRLAELDSESASR